MADKELKILQSLAQLHGLQTTYLDVAGKRQRASRESLTAVLSALDVPLAGPSDLLDAFRRKKRYGLEQRLEPVTVAWNGKATGIRFLARLDESRVRLELRLESGEKRSWTCDLARRRPMHYEDFEGLHFVARELCIDEILPFGYHELTVENREGLFRTKILSAPERAFSEKSVHKQWGVFIPLYSLRSTHNHGAGDFGDMAELYRWLGGIGGSIVGTLPFLAAFMEEPFEPSPYSPASRLFWNEFYISPEMIPELKRSSPGSSLLAYADRAAGEPRSASLVDYRRVMAIKRKVLSELSREYFSGSDRNRELIDQYRRDNPLLDDYAAFRAYGEKTGSPWPQWPEPQRSGSLAAGDFEADDRDYHLYAQWTASRQIKKLASEAEKTGPGLYLDMPLGIHPYSYDSWRNRDLFPEGVAGGAPPDLVFKGGQNWGFPPLHPGKIRESGYEYVISYVRKLMRRAGLLRIDHIPGVHRIYWIPRGMDASRGVFVRYNAEEFYAVLSLESHRNRCEIAGENLGTVPRYVNEAMGRHNIHKMYVIQYEVEGTASGAPGNVPAASISSLNTHDMTPFAGFLKGADIRERVDAGILTSGLEQAEIERRRRILEGLERFFIGKGLIRSAGAREENILRAALAYLAMSPSRFVLINLEDLWLEVESQNLPGTTGERNWRRKARYGLEEFRTMPEVAGMLRVINRLRKETGKKK